MQIRNPDYIGIYTQSSNENYAYSDLIKKADVAVRIFIKEELLHVQLTANVTPEKWLLNGRETHFCWYEKTPAKMF